jgi:hypothetical protein
MDSNFDNLKRLIESIKTVGFWGSVNSGHVDPSFWDVDPPAKQAIKVRA